LPSTRLPCVSCISGVDWSDNVGGDEARQQHHSTVSHLVCDARRDDVVRPDLSSSAQCLFLSRVRPRHGRRLPLLQNLDACEKFAGRLTRDGHFSGKPGNVREFCNCQGNVGEKILSGKTVF